MVSPLSAASIAPSNSPFGQRLLAVSGHQDALDASVSKQNTSGVPKLHVDSFQTFGHAFDTALRQPGSSQASDPETTGTLEFKIGTPGSTQPSQAATSSDAVAPDKLGDKVSQFSEMFKGVAGGMPAREVQDLNTSDSTSEIGDQTEPLNSKKTPDSKVTAKEQAETPARNSNEPLYPSILDADRNPRSGPALELNEFQSTPSNTVSGNQSETVRTTNLSAARRNPVLSDANPQINPSEADGEIEAFRMDLRAAADFVQQGDFENGARLTLKAETATASGQQVFGSGSQNPLQNLPAGAGTGTVDKASAPNQTPNAPQAGQAKATPVSPSVQADRSQISATGPQAGKSSDKTAGNSTSDSGIPKGSIVPPGPPFLVSARGASETKELKSGAGVTETNDLAETPVGSAAHEMVVRFQGNSGEVVSVRLLDQGGQVQVAVRSNDPLTASQLRQDLSSLTSNLDRIGWKADTAAATGPQPLSQDTSRSDSERQSGHTGAHLAWDESPAKRRHSTAELWDKVLAGQNP